MKIFILSNLAAPFNQIKLVQHLMRSQRQHPFIRIPFLRMNYQHMEAKNEAYISLILVHSFIQPSQCVINITQQLIIPQIKVSTSICDETSTMFCRTYQMKHKVHIPRSCKRDVLGVFLRRFLLSFIIHDSTYGFHFHILPQD